MTARERADRLLVARGLFESRARAQAAIAAGRVTADGVPVRKASEEISSAAVIAAEPEHPYVSRGGVKLAAALDQFHLDVTGRVCLDVGASTGGFTEVLLGRGARRVYAVDVGRDQLHPRLRGRDEIVSMEETDIRTLDPARLAEQPDFATVDVSFISLKLVVAGGRQIAQSARRARCADQAAIRGRPPRHQERHRARRGGARRDLRRHRRFLTSLGWRVGGVVPSPIPGGDGNREFFIEAERG